MVLGKSASDATGGFLKPVVNNLAVIKDTTAEVEKNP